MDIARVGTESAPQLMARLAHRRRRWVPACGGGGPPGRSAHSTDVVSDRAGQCLRSIRAGSKHPRVMPYRRLMAAVVLVNLAMVVERCAQARGSSPTARRSPRVDHHARQPDGGRPRQGTRASSTPSTASRDGGHRRGRCGSAGAFPRSTTSAGCTSGAPIAGTPSLAAFTSVAIVTAIRYPGSVTGFDGGSVHRVGRPPVGGHGGRDLTGPHAAPTTCSSRHTGGAGGRRSPCSGR